MCKTRTLPVRGEVEFCGETLRSKARGTGHAQVEKMLEGTWGEVEGAGHGDGEDLTCNS